MNRLGEERSPYLRQHAHNPVDWYPWGPEALERAREANRPILLSIGYSACHWCHVMERESFDDPEVARIMNEGFVNVKVDREERPDVDSLYMRAVQALSGQGGWPLTVFLTPEGEPFYGGTYFPPEPRHGLPSFRQLLVATLSAWDERPEEVRAASAQLTDILRRSLRPDDTSTRSADGAPEVAGETPSLGDLAGRGAEEILRRFDPVFGGFGRAPKFPQPVVLEFLLEHHALSGDAASLEAVLLTLRRMADGGVRDHLGGGFHRYSVDQRWLVPHFEKMLYDNALLATVYLRAHQLTGEADLASVARGVLDDLLDDFRSPDGAFYTARDADSEGAEGTFYLWTSEEVEALLPPAEAALFVRAYGMTPEGNFEGRNILHRPDGWEASAREDGADPADLEARLAAARATLRTARALRPHPLRDDKVLAGWNALAIRAFAEAGATLGEPRYLRAAERCGAWLLSALRPEGRLLHLLPGHGPLLVAFLEDVAGLGNALLSLHEATLDPVWLREAIDLDREVEERFRDPESGLLHDTPSDGESLFLRPREVSDSPVPSGHSLAAELRLRLGRLLGDDDRVRQAESFVRQEGAGMEAMPMGFGRLLAVAGRLAHPSIEIVLLGAGDDRATQALLREAHRPFLPGKVVSGVRRGEPPPVSGPLFDGRRAHPEAPTAFVCRGFVCQAPTTDPDEVAQALSARV